MTQRAALQLRPARIGCQIWQPIPTAREAVHTRNTAESELKGEFDRCPRRRDRLQEPAAMTAICRPAYRMAEL